MEKSGRTEEKAGEPGITYWRLKKLVLEKFPEIVSDAVMEREPGDNPRNLRIFLVDDSFLKVWISEKNIHTTGSPVTKLCGLITHRTMTESKHTLIINIPTTESRKVPSQANRNRTFR